MGFLTDILMLVGAYVFGIMLCDELNLHSTESYYIAGMIIGIFVELIYIATNFDVIHKN